MADNFPTDTKVAIGHVEDGRKTMDFELRANGAIGWSERPCP